MDTPAQTIVDIINGEIASRDAVLPEISSDLRIRVCTTEGLYQGADRSAVLAWVPEKDLESVADSLKYICKKAYGNTLSDEDVKNIISSAPDLKNDDIFETKIRGMKFYLQDMKASDALEQHILDNHMPVIFNSIATNNMDEKFDYLQYLPQKLPENITLDILHRAYRCGMRKTTEENLENIKPLVAFQMEGGIEPEKYWGDFHVQVNKKDNYRDEDFAKNWRLTAMQEIPPKQQYEYLQLLKTLGEKGENRESATFVNSMIEKIWFKDCPTLSESLKEFFKTFYKFNKPYIQQLDLLMEYLEKEDFRDAFFARDMKYHHGIAFSKNGDNVLVYLLYGFADGTRARYMETIGRLTVHEFLDREFFEKFFKENSRQFVMENETSSVPSMNM